MSPVQRYSVRSGAWAILGGEGGIVTPPPPPPPPPPPDVTSLLLSAHVEGVAPSYWQTQAPVQDGRSISFGNVGLVPGRTLTRSTNATPTASLSQTITEIADTDFDVTRVTPTVAAGRILVMRNCRMNRGIGGQGTLYKEGEGLLVLVDCEVGGEASTDFSANLVVLRGGSFISCRTYFHDSGDMWRVGRPMTSLEDFFARQRRFGTSPHLDTFQAYGGVAGSHLRILGSHIQAVSDDRNEEISAAVFLGNDNGALLGEVTVNGALFGRCGPVFDINSVHQNVTIANSWVTPNPDPGGTTLLFRRNASTVTWANNRWATSGTHNGTAKTAGQVANPTD